MKKSKMLACLSAVCCLLTGTLAAMPASAVTASADVPEGLSYKITDDNEVTITKWDDSAPHVDVPEEIEGLPVTKIGNSAFVRCYSLESFTLPNTIREIGEYAFKSCTSLKEAVIPDSVTVIKDDLFNGCYRLQHVTMPASVEESGGLLFDECSMLEEITLPEGLTHVGSADFAKCSSLQRIVVPESASMISYHAMAECEQLATVVIKNPDIRIENSAETISSGINLETGEPFFDGVIYGYEGSTAQKYAETYGYAFAPISEVPEEDPPRPENLPKGLSFSRQDDHIAIRKWYGTDEEVIVPEEIYGLPVTLIGKEVFANDHITISPKKVILPDSVTEIGKAAFGYQHDLEDVVLSNSLEIIGEDAFNSCDALTSLALPDTLTTIGKNAYRGCKGLTTVTIPEHVTLIDEYAFSYCDHLEEVIIPNTDITLSKFAFAFNPALPGIQLPDHLSILSQGLLDGCTGLRSITIPENVTAIEHQVFRNCKLLEDITVPASVERIDPYAFYLCSALNTITILNPNCEIADVVETISNTTKAYDGVIRGYAGSTAQAYADKFGYAFEAITEDPTPFLLGDVDFNGTVDSSDAQMTLGAYLKTVVNNPLGLTDLQILAADIDKNNEITSTDAQYILIYFLRNSISHIPTDWSDIVSE